MTNHIADRVLSPCAKPKGMHRAMARYQALYGLKPVGPHRHLAASLLNNITEPCTTCGGTGLYGTYGSLGWRVCPTCRGFGEAYRISLDELEALRQKVLAQYPDAAPEGWAPGYPILCPIRILANDLMIDACPARDDDPVQRELFPALAVPADRWLPWGMCVPEEPKSEPETAADAEPVNWSFGALARFIWNKLNTLV